MVELSLIEVQPSPKIPAGDDYKSSPAGGYRL